MSDTKFERARLIGARALQISKGAPLLIKLSEKELEEINYNPVEIAKKEYDKKLLFMDIKRPMPKKRK
ncbi:DNA-directed RNA polymerase subunit K [Candidatus Woesearchaeota archaeon]|nr:DNA-directed RNA polymerase subunit K [Candidatus Woesearchaeota archaeon]